MASNILAIQDVQARGSRAGACGGAARASHAKNVNFANRAKAGDFQTFRNKFGGDPQAFKQMMQKRREMGNSNNFEDFGQNQMNQANDAPFSQLTNKFWNQNSPFSQRRKKDYTPNRDVDYSYNKDTGTLTKEITQTGTTKNGGTYEKGKTVSSGQGQGYEKNVDLSGTTAAGGAYDRNKVVTAGQGQGYNKNVDLEGTTASGGNYSRKWSAGNSTSSSVTSANPNSQLLDQQSAVPAVSGAEPGGDDDSKDKEEIESPTESPN